jgi:CubicO group peptidase (beta-lactamase class C family)
LALPACGAAAAEAIQAVRRQPRLRSAPGTQWSHSNVNYMLLAEVVRRVSGIAFSEFVRREVFEPLGMKSSLVNDDLGAVVPNRVTGYNARPSGGYRQEIRRAPTSGAAACSRASTTWRGGTAASPRTTSAAPSSPRCC